MKSLPATFVRICVLGAGWVWVVSAALAGAGEPDKVSKLPAELENFTLEQLVNVQVTSVSKKETDLFTSPAAIYVITQEDIHRSGLSSIPELLRLVPGLEVARIDANHWAITSRGFNSQFANKLLVLIDGRSVYTPLSGGVYWNDQDLPLEDLERIEVIRGPGASLWGANAVNGVINIISKSAKETQGGLATVTYGTENQPSTTVRYGGQLATNLFYRVYVKYFNDDSFTTSTGQDAADAWSAIRSGFRLDWEPSTENNFTLSGDYYYSHAGETVDLATLTPPYMNRQNFVDHNKGANVLGRWTHNYSDASQLNVQLYYDYSEQGDAPNVLKNNTYDFDLQHRFALGTRQDIVWGAGYRHVTVDASQSFYATFTPDTFQDQLFSTFLQDTITLVEERLNLTLGSRFEHNDITGLEVEPSIRLTWTPTKKQTVWAAVSRAVRTPSYLELDIQNNRSVVQPPAGPPVLVSVFGNQNLNSEQLTAYELGYRIKPIESLSFDATAFYNVYDQLIATAQGTPFFEAAPAPPHVVVPLVFKNNQTAETYGAEVLGEWRATENWRLVASYTYLHMDLHPAPAFNDNPQNQFQIHSYLNLPHHIGLDAAVYYVERIGALFGDTSTSIPAYVRVDLGVTWRPIKTLELGIFGQNLLDDHHLESTSYKTTVLTEIPRGIMGRIIWSF
jgi:iron complex outermembrane receptor protein